MGILTLLSWQRLVVVRLKPGFYALKYCAEIVGPQFLVSSVEEGQE